MPGDNFEEKLIETLRRYEFKTSEDEISSLIRQIFHKDKQTIFIDEPSIIHAIANETESIIKRVSLDNYSATMKYKSPFLLFEHEYDGFSAKIDKGVRDGLLQTVRNNYLHLLATEIKRKAVNTANCHSKWNIATFVNIPSADNLEFHKVFGRKIYDITLQSPIEFYAVIKARTPQ